MADRTVQINSFKYGLDTRRDALASLPGTLQLANNCYVDAGGEINKRKAFVPVDSSHIKLPAGCFGLQDTDTGLMTFGSVTTPAGMPSGVTYQQLAYPVNPAPGSMTAVVFSCSFLGKAFVLATFDNENAVFAYYNGILVGQITDGIVKPSPGGGGVPETIGDLARDLAAIINRVAGANDLGTLGWSADANVTALPYNGVANNQNWATNLGYLETALAGSVLVMTPPKIRLTPTVKNNNSVSGILGFKLIDQDYPGIGAQGAFVAFTITSAGVNTGDTITVTAPAKADGTGTAALSGGAVTFNTSLNQTALDVAAAINNNTFLTGYTAIAQSATVTVYAPISFGAFQNVTPHQLIIDTTGNLTTTTGAPFSQIQLTVTLGTQNQGSVQGVNETTITATASVSGVSLTGGVPSLVTFTWSQIDSNNNDIVLPPGQFGANFFGIFPIVGAFVTIVSGFNSGVHSQTARFRCTATDHGNNTTATLFFSVTLTHA